MASIFSNDHLIKDGDTVKCTGQIVIFQSVRNFSALLLMPLEISMVVARVPSRLLSVVAPL